MSGNCDELRGGDHAGGTGADDEDVDVVGELVGTVEADAGRRLDAGIAGHVAVVVELHRSSVLLVAALLGWAMPRTGADAQVLARP